MLTLYYIKTLCESLKSRYLCLQQLYTFSVGKLGVYRRKTDGKEIPGLLKLLDKDEKATSEGRKCQIAV